MRGKDQIVSWNPDAVEIKNGSVHFKDRSKPYLNMASEIGPYDQARVFYAIGILAGKSVDAQTILDIVNAMLAVGIEIGRGTSS